MQTTIKNKILLVLLTMLTFNASVFAQDDPGLPTDQDPGAVPIDDYIPYVIFAIVLISFFVLQRTKRSTN